MDFCSELPLISKPKVKSQWSPDRKHKSSNESLAMKSFVAKVIPDKK